MNRSRKLNIGLLGTRGIPNHYGGFEQFAQQFGLRMAERGHTVSVYSSSTHRYQKSEYRGVRILRCEDPERYLGTAGQFIYDLNCIRDARRRNFDVLMQLGYTSSSIWSRWFPKAACLVTNMDGLEWKRSKYGTFTRQFLRKAEAWAVRHSDVLIADSRAIALYLQRRYGVSAHFIPYGAELVNPGNTAAHLPQEFGLESGCYDLAVARFEPENNIEAMLKAYTAAGHQTLALVGDYQRTSFGRSMYRQYGMQKSIRFLQAVFDPSILNRLRCSARLYVHGHSVGGTNPSLLEAMACRVPIAAHDNEFNRDVLGLDAFYFSTAEELRTVLSHDLQQAQTNGWVERYQKRLEELYHWDRITEQLETLFYQNLNYGR